MNRVDSHGLTPVALSPWVLDSSELLRAEGVAGVPTQVGRDLMPVGATQAPLMEPIQFFRRSLRGGVMFPPLSLSGLLTLQNSLAFAPIL